MEASGVDRYGFKLEKVGGCERAAYRISDTSLFVIKGPAPRYRHPQEWDIVASGGDHTDLPLVTGHSLDNALFRLAKVRELLGRVA